MASVADVSEFQRGYTPGGHDGYIIRTVGDSNREDFEWRNHYSRVGGTPKGAYGIFSPVYDPRGWTERFIATLTAVQWQIVPTIDIELGGAAAARDFASVAVGMLHDAGFPVVMGYYSRDSAYRSLCAGLFQRQWIAAYGSPFPAGADMHQYTSTPYDQSFVPQLGTIIAPSIVPPKRRRFYEEPFFLS